MIEMCVSQTTYWLKYDTSEKTPIDTHFNF